MDRTQLQELAVETWALKDARLQAHTCESCIKASMQTSATSAASLAFSPTLAECCTSAAVPGVCAALSCGVPSHLQPRNGAAKYRLMPLTRRSNDGLD